MATKNTFYKKAPLLSLGVLLLIAVAVPMTVFLSQSKTKIEEHAAGFSSTPILPTSVQSPVATIQPGSPHASTPCLSQNKVFEQVGSAQNTYASSAHVYGHLYESWDWINRVWCDDYYLHADVDVAPYQAGGNTLLSISGPGNYQYTDNWFYAYPTGNYWSFSKNYGHWDSSIIHTTQCVSGWVNYYGGSGSYMPQIFVCH